MPAAHRELQGAQQNQVHNLNVARGLILTQSSEVRLGSLISASREPGHESTHWACPVTRSQIGGQPGV